MYNECLCNRVYLGYKLNKCCSLPSMDFVGAIIYGLCRNYHQSRSWHSWTLQELSPIVFARAVTSRFQEAVIRGLSRSFHPWTFREPTHQWTFMELSPMSHQESFIHGLSRNSHRLWKNCDITRRRKFPQTETKKPYCVIEAYFHIILKNDNFKLLTFPRIMKYTHYCKLSDYVVYSIED